MKTCRQCGISEKTKGARFPLKPSSVSYDKDKTYSYYLCTKCNTEVCRKYRNTETGMAKVREAVARSTEKYKYKQNARANLNYHVKVGNIFKPPQCTVCKKVKIVEGHHMDYTKPLDVIWLCRQCHSDIHI